MAEPHRCPRCQAIVTDTTDGPCPVCLTQPDPEGGALTVPHSGKAGDTVSRAPAAPEPIIGPVPDGDPTRRYRIDGEIGRGGMGAVFKGRDHDLGRDVAL